MSGGAGADIFIYRLAEGADTIGDFGDGAANGDCIRLEGFGPAFDSFEEVLAAAAQVGSDVVLDFGGVRGLSCRALPSALWTPAISYLAVPKIAWGGGIVGDDHGEERTLAIGKIERRFYALCYTRRGEKIRVIGLRKATAYERRRYREGG